jgi:DNA invertase Pin-like site-specific DNA recombinase
VSSLQHSYAFVLTRGILVGLGPLTIDASRVREMKAQGLSATAIAKTLGIGPASVYRVLEVSIEGPGAR